jgi:hypothetical protein
MKIGKCRNCTYFDKDDWKAWDKEIGFHVFGMFGLSHRILRVCGHCMDKDNPDFNIFAKQTGRGIGKIQAIFSPKWCRFRIR